jgi:hypothetical protein
MIIEILERDASPLSNVGRPAFFRHFKSGRRHENPLKFPKFQLVTIALMTEAVRPSETPACSNENTLRYISEGSKLHIRRRENLKSHSYIQIVRVTTETFTSVVFCSIYHPSLFVSKTHRKVKYADRAIVNMYTVV